ncbi:hypothetical protein O181_097312 [Austropuccinia psidii MF-1]|uniref:Uncharacterized protein n=1 Tax=Austropuccinia psidii MF-1 TaxID=1389203 RepID=A0A9Q3J915_9BASI|nr:hypothetical protein [Austropuccinia psidii MF-1]
MGRGKLTLYSLVLQPPPLFKHYHQAMQPLISPCSLTFKNFQLERLYFVLVLNLSNSSCRALSAPSWVSPAFIPQQQLTLVMLANKHTRNVHLLSAPSDQAPRGVLAQDTLSSTPLWSTMIKLYLSTNGHQDPKQANGNDSGQLALPLKH